RCNEGGGERFGLKDVAGFPGKAPQCGFLVLPGAEEKPLDRRLDHVPDVMKGEKHAKSDRGVDDRIAFSALDFDEMIERPFDQSEAREQYRTYDAVSQRAVERKTEIEHPMAEDGVGEGDGRHHAGEKFVDD